ncbi:MAG TPA: MFS transporter [Gaiellaceae bacterium]|nr:MFS transporter [Gaiellaceae bacterium]
MARADIDRRAMAALSSGHMAVDFAGGVLPALLPFLVVEWDLSYTYAGGLILASALAGSVVQPLFGLWSDRRGAVWLLPAGVAIGAIGMGLAALSPSYWWVVLFVVVSGLGTAAYHPEGSKFAAYASGSRRASGMSLFSIGGNLGYSLGVIVTTPIVVALGIAGGALVVLPCLVVAAVLLWLVPFLLTFVPVRGDGSRDLHGDDRLGAMALLLGVVTVRSIAWFGLITFVPLWEVSIGNSEGYGNFLLSIMLLAGAAGTLLAGPAADRFGRRPVLLVSNLVVPPAIAVFILAGGAAGAVSLVLIGASVVGTFGVTMVMSQEYMPRHIGMASGLSIGLSIGLGGIAAVLLGAIADSVDLETALWVCAAAPVAGIVLTLLLPPTRERARLAPEIASP